MSLRAKEEIIVPTLIDFTCSHPLAAIKTPPLYQALFYTTWSDRSEKRLGTRCGFVMMMRNFDGSVTEQLSVSRDDREKKNISIQKNYFVELFSIIKKVHYC